MTPSMARVVSEAELDDLVAADRRGGRTLGFANGCFDLLHVGHARYLEGASREADRLIVAVNDDQSVRRLKGAGQPVLPVAARAELVAALRGVDYVVVFSGPTVAPLLLRIKPDVHCKGTDYTVDSVPERDVVRAYGGRVAIVGDPKQHSTHALLARLREDSRPTPVADAQPSEHRRQPSVGPWLRFLQRRRVAMGFLLAALVLWFAQPTPTSITLALLIALPGEVLRIWAAGHITKGREVTRSGPYRLVRHPLYLGSTILGVGFAVGTARLLPALLVLTYLAVTIPAAMVAEEAELDAQFGYEYAAYRTGTASAVDRAFSLDRAVANHELRTMLGFAVGIALLALRMAIG